MTNGDLAAGAGSAHWEGANWANTKDATAASGLRYYIEFSYEQVAGTTYTFIFDVMSTGDHATATYAYLNVFAGGNTLYQGSTYPASGVSYITPDGVYRTFGVSYVATTTGTTTFRYELAFSQHGAGPGISNHDLVLGTPNIVCS